MYTHALPKESCVGLVEVDLVAAEGVTAAPELAGAFGKALALARLSVKGEGVAGAPPAAKPVGSPPPAPSPSP
eukprot:7141377-Alexandrium_andersonii.AAC.1